MANRPPQTLLLTAALLSISGTAIGLTPLPSAQERPEIVQLDLDGNGTEETVVLFRDREGRAVRAMADTNGDGLADIWVKYDPDGETMSELAIDIDHDERADQWRYFENGQLVRIGRDTRDDGRPDIWSVLEQGSRVVAVWTDTTNDGEPDVWAVYSDTGTIAQVSYDTNGDGRAELWVNYDAAGEVASIQRDVDGDGRPDEVVLPR